MTRTTPLHQLPDGTWIDIRHVVAVQMFPRRQGVNFLNPSRVVVTLATGTLVEVRCESDDDAEQLRDLIARRVNTWEAPQ